MNITLKDMFVALNRDLKPQNLAALLHTHGEEPNSRVRNLNQLARQYPQIMAHTYLAHGNEDWRYSAAFCCERNGEGHFTNIRAIPRSAVTAFGSQKYWVLKISTGMHTGPSFGVHRVTFRQATNVFEDFALSEQDLEILANTQGCDMLARAAQFQLRQQSPKEKTA